MINLLLMAAGVFIVAVLATAAVRFYAVKKQILDIPGERSSHSLPTPRGGGLGILVAVMGGLILLPITGNTVFLMPLIPGVLLALLCFWDDHGHIGFQYRLLAQLTAVIALLFILGGAPWLTLFFWSLQDSLSVYILLVVTIVWFINLFNFMDGIDGIAGLESVSICIGLMVLGFMSGQVGQYWFLSLVLLAACLGFLLWNFPRARIFMGDVGSVFCGYCLALIFLLAGAQSSILFWSGIILAGVFIVDASVTLLVRLASGKKIWKAHRSHAYQHAARLYNSHIKISMTVTIINLCWLLPIASLVLLEQLAPAWALVVAYAPLVGLAVWLNAGRAETT
ncbi:MAG TPA: glycosyltransferase family 4 protein [Cellvibrionaceae bacterium]